MTLLGTLLETTNTREEGQLNTKIHVTSYLAAGNEIEKKMQLFDNKDDSVVLYPDRRRLRLVTAKKKIRKSKRWKRRDRERERKNFQQRDKVEGEDETQCQL